MDNAIDEKYYVLQMDGLLWRWIIFGFGRIIHPNYWDLKIGG